MKKSIVCLLAGSICLFILFLAGAEKPRLNLLLITMDTLRPDRLSCYSPQYLQTPTVDELAAKSVLFTRAFAHTPTTLPSHANILLGTTPSHHGVHDNGLFVVRPEFLSLAELLKANGYATGAFVGAFPLDSRFGLDQGFDVYDDSYGTQPAHEFAFLERKAADVIDSALNWLKGQASPWFLWVHCFDPHQPYEPPEPFRSRYKDDLYSGEVAYADSALARLLAYLKEIGAEKETVVVYTGDHGQSLGEHGETTHGYFAYNSTLWVPLILSSPGTKPGLVEQSVCHIDIFPTVCDLLGIPKPSFLQGISLLPALKGNPLPERTIYFESLYPYYRRGWAPLKGFIEGETKFIDSPIPELYDIKRDFKETKNLGEKADMSKERATLALLIEKETSGGSPAAPRIDVRVQEKLKSLGYVGTVQAVRKENFTAADDLKTLLRFNRKFEEAVDLYDQGNVERAIELLKQLISERKDFDSAYSYLTTIYVKLGRMNEVVDMLRKAHEDNPGSYKIALDFGIFLMEAGRYDESILVLNKAMALLDYDPELWNFLGMDYYHKGDIDRALEAYQHALSLDSSYTLVLNNLGAMYLTLFMKNRNTGDYRRAVDFFKKAIEFDPRYTSAYNGLGSAYRQAGDLESAIYCWEKTLEIDSRHQFALFNLGIGHLDKGDKEKALDYFSRYKKVYYDSLTAQEKDELEAFIEKCRRQSLEIKEKNG